MPEATNPASNLLRATPVEKVVRPAGFYFSLTLDILAVLSAALLGLFYRLYLRGDWSIFGMIGVLALFSIFAPLGMMLTKSLNRRLGVLAGAALALGVFFYDWPILFLFTAVLVFFGFSAWGEILGRGELQNSIEIKMSRVMSLYLNKLVTGVALLLVALYLPQWNAEEGFLVSRENFEGFFASTARAAAVFYPELKFDSTVGEFGKSLAEMQLKGSLAYLQLLPAAREKAAAEAAQQVIQNLGSKLGSEILPEQPLSRIFYSFLIKTLAGWKEKFGNQFLFVWALLAFFVVRGIGMVFYLVMKWLVYFLYQLLLATSVIKIVGESRVHETLEYS